jgi:hypothetical protein
MLLIIGKIYGLAIILLSGIIIYVGSLEWIQKAIRIKKC